MKKPEHHFIIVCKKCGSGKCGMTCGDNGMDEMVVSIDCGECGTSEIIAEYDYSKKLKEKGYTWRVDD